MKTAIGCIAVIIGFVIIVLVALVFGALAIGAANAWFLSGNFSDGWSLAWQKPFVLFGWSCLFIGSLGAGSSARRR